MLKCDMCGQSDFIKQGGVFVCQNCGMKYSLEDAKCMMQNCNAENFESEEINNDSVISKYQQNANLSLQREDWENAEKYFELVKQNNPTDVEAIFYSSYAKARLSMVENDYYKREQICEVFCKAIASIGDNYNAQTFVDNQKIIQKMSDSLFKMFNGSFVYNVYSNGNNMDKTYYLFGLMSLNFVDCVEKIEKTDKKGSCLKIIYEHLKYVVGNLSLPYDVRENCRIKAINIVAEIRKEDKSYDGNEELTVVNKKLFISNKNWSLSLGIFAIIFSIALQIIYFVEGTYFESSPFISGAIILAGFSIISILISSSGCNLCRKATIICNGDKSFVAGTKKCCTAGKVLGWISLILDVIVLYGIYN